ncbi:DUF3825 domain-containing protein [Slackia exigua]|uniref:DUF3825 domain-containing protein n=1 Tax=Slackia exigua TaxID=84109 RepID=UPI0028D22A0E|nr:DUF3825 domain-containing protein [Slackia exigua]
MPSKNTQPPTLSFEDAQHIYRILTKSFTFEEEYPLANLGWCFVREGIDKESYGFIKLRTMLAELEFVTLSSREISGEFQSTFILHEAPGYALDAPEGASGEPDRADAADAAGGAAETGSPRPDAAGGAGSEDADGSEAADDSAADAQDSDEAPAAEAAAKASSETAAAEEPASSVEAQAEPEAEPAEKAPKKPARARATRSRKKKEEPAADEAETPSASAESASASSATPADSDAEGADAKSAPAKEAEKDASDETSAPAKPARARATRTTKAAKTTRTRKTAKKAEAEKPAASDDAEERANPDSDAASTAASDGATVPVADAVAEVSSESEAASAAAADADAAAEPASAPVKKTRRTARKKAAPKTKAADAEPVEAAEAAPSQADASVSDTEAIDTEAEAEKKPARTRTTRRRTSTKMKTGTESDDAADGAENASASEAPAPSSEKSVASSETPEASAASDKSASAPAETVEAPAPDASASSESAPESASEATPEAAPEAAPALSSSRRGRRGGRGRGRGRGDAERKEDASADQGAETSEQSGDAKPAAGRTASRSRGRQQKSVAASDVLRSTIRRNRRYAPARVFERFAYLGHWKDFLKSLAAIALPEPWDFNGDADAAPRRYTILSNYIRYTFYRLTLEDKIGYSSDETFCAFNTGLVDTHYDDIYACFERNEKTEAFQPWSFTSFCTAGTGRYGKQLVRELNPLPQPASYLSRKEDLLFDLDRQIVCDIEHIVIDNIHRLPLEFLRDELASSKECIAVLADIESAPDAEAEAEAYDSLRTIISTKSRLFSRLSNSVNAAIDIARRQVRWNYKTAVPAYYPRTNNMNLLLPLNLTEDNIPDVALVVELQKSGNYQGQTIITMVQAYRDARLVCRPYIDWLSPATIVDEMDDDDDDDGQDPEGETEA